MRRVLEGRERGQQPTERPLTPVHTHPSRRARGRTSLWGRSFPGDFSPVSQHRWATDRAGGVLGNVQIGHGGRVAALPGPASKLGLDEAGGAQFRVPRETGRREAGAAPGDWRGGARWGTRRR